LTADSLVAGKKPRKTPRRAAKRPAAYL
jgi:hypothetical protein